MIESYTELAKEGKEKLDKQNIENLIEKLNFTHGVNITKMDVELGF
jgi:hypothetical protein